MRLLVVVLALVVTGAAVAAPPPDFRGSYRLTKKAMLLGEPTSRAYCANSGYAWRAYMASVGLPNQIQGVTLRDAPEIYLRPSVCDILEGWLKGKPRSNYTLAYYIYVFTHETQHTLGVVDECAADRRALNLFGKAARLFNVKSAARVFAMRQTLVGRTRCV